MNIRKEMLQNLYDDVVNNSLCEDPQKASDEMVALIEKSFVTGSDEEDEAMRKMCEHERAAFMAGANLVLDFIAGREVR